MKILVTGGAGYIGSFTVRELLKRGDEVVIFDNLICGHRESLPLGVKLYEGDLLDKDAINRVFETDRFDAVVHFASYIAAGESMENPYKYFHSNVEGSLNLIEAVAAAGVKQFVFSSSACLYGQPKKLPVKEDDPIDIANVYGETKFMTERTLFWYHRIFGLRSVCLRYFNACGASLDGSLGEDHRPETHIIPMAVSAALGLRGSFDLYGTDYPTADGTGVRDYIHVLDLASAHILALDYLVKGNDPVALNVGVGRGYSNREILEEIKRVAGHDFTVVTKPRRAGDANEIYADNTKIKEVLGWQPRYGLKEIVESAYLWHKTHPYGYVTVTQ